MSERDEEARLPARLDNAQAPLAKPVSERVPAERPPLSAVATFERLEPTASPLQEYLNLLLRRKRTVLLSLLVIFGAAIAGTATMPRLYEATATLLVSNASGSQPGDLDSQIPAVMVATVAPNLETHVELVQGQPMAREAARWLKEHEGLSLTPGAIRRSLRVKAVPKTQLVRISALGHSPLEAEKIANAISQSYVAANRRRAQSSAESASRYLAEQLAMARNNLAEVETALRAFNESAGTVAVDTEARHLLGRVALVQTDADRTSADLAQAQEGLDRVRAQLSEQSKSILAGQVRDNAALQRLRAQLVELEGQRLAAQSRYTPEFSAPLEEIDQQIVVVRQQLSAEIHNVVGSGGDLAVHETLTGELIQGEAQVAALKARERQLQEALRSADQELRKIPAEQIALARLQRQMEVAQNVYSSLLKRSQEIEVGRVMALGNTDIAEAASAPRLPVNPNVPLNLALGLVLGLGVGIGLALLQEQFDDSVRDQDEVVRLVNAPILGTVPLFEAGGRPALLLGQLPHGRVMEAYRALRYSLSFVMPGEGARVVLVTSSDPLEGKSTTALNLALAAAASGRRAVLVECDLRRPSLHRALNLNGSKGVSDVLVGQVVLSDALQTLPETELRILTAGTRAPNPADLLDSAAMRTLVEELRKNADLVVFDSPPLLSVADPLVLASLSDAVLMVCVPGDSHRRALQRSRLLLTQVGHTVSGVVLNKVQQRAGYGYYSRYYYYQSYGYGEADGEQELARKSS